MQSKKIATLLGDTTTRVRDTRTGSNSTKHKFDPSRGRGGSEGATHAREANRQIKNATPHANEMLRKARHTHEKQIDKSKMRPLTHMRCFGKHDTRTKSKTGNEISDRDNNEAVSYTHLRSPRDS